MRRQFRLTVYIFKGDQGFCFAGLASKIYETTLVGDQEVVVGSQFSLDKQLGHLQSPIKYIYLIIRTEIQKWDIVFKRK